MPGRNRLAGMSRPSAAKQKGLQATLLPLHRRHVYQPDVSSGKDPVPAPPERLLCRRVASEPRTTGG